MGVEFDCPTHGFPCRLEIYFSNAIDGGEHATIGGHAERLYTQRNGSLSALTILERVDFPEHWTGKIERGQMLTEN